MAVYLRDLTNDIIKLNQNLRLNSIIPKGLGELIESKVPENNYILGVKYIQGDSQICISGHQKDNELLKEGCVRELTEELFLKCKNSIQMHYNIGDNYFFSISLKDTYISKTYIKNSSPDIKNRAIICVYGNEFEILRYMSKIKIQNKLNDNICGIWAARKDKVLASIKKINNDKKTCYIY